MELDSVILRLNRCECLYIICSGQVNNEIVLIEILSILLESEHYCIFSLAFKTADKHSVVTVNKRSGSTGSEDYRRILDYSLIS